MTSDRSEAFDAIYLGGGWGGRGSGGGSDPIGARPYVEFVLSVIDRLRPLRVLDVGCGDMQLWPSGAFACVGEYTGIDVSQVVVEDAIRQNVEGNRRFMVLDAVVDELPDADLLLCKEVVQHLAKADALALLSRLSNACPRVIVCADSAMRSTSVLRRAVRRAVPILPGGVPRVNSEIPTGGYRPVDLGKPPFDELGFHSRLTYRHDIGSRCRTEKTIWTRGL